MTALARAEKTTLVMIDLQAQPLARLDPATVRSLRLACAGALRAAAHLDLPVICSERADAGALDRELEALLPASAWRASRTAVAPWSDESLCNALEIAGREQIALCGVDAHAGVVQTALSLLASGYRVFLLEDAVASSRPALRDHALRRAGQQGAQVCSLASLVYEWLDGRADAAITRSLLDGV